MENIKQQFMVIMGYLGAVIGAGFASGQEIVQFFVLYGPGGARGVILAMLLFGLCGGWLLYKAHDQKISNYQDMLKLLLGHRLGAIMDLLLAIFLFLGISTMLSASGAVFYEHLYLPKNLGIFLAYIIIVILLATGKKGLILSYNMLVPVKIVLLLIISGYAAIFVEQSGPATYSYALPGQGTHTWIIGSILYVAYNFALAMVVLTEYRSVTTRRNGIIGALWGGVILGGFVIVNYYSLCKFLPAVIHYQVPMLYVAGQISVTAKHIYSIVLWLGIITTAIANTYGFAQRLANFTGLGYKICLVISVTMAIPLSLQSFASLVARIYPIFGILGIAIISALLYKTTKEIGLELYYRINHLFGRTEEA